MGEQASLFFMVPLLRCKHHKKKGVPGAYGTCLCWCWAQLLQQSQPAVPGVPGTEAITSKHHTGLRALSGFNQQKIDEHIYLSCPTDFSFFLDKPLSNTESDPLWILFYDFLFKCRKYRSKQQILLKDKSNELEFTSSLAGDPVLLCCPSLQFWLLGTLF